MNDMIAFFLGMAVCYSYFSYVKGMEFLFGKEWKFKDMINQAKIKKGTKQHTPIKNIKS